MSCFSRIIKGFTELFTKNCHFKFLAGLSFKSGTMQFSITYIERAYLVLCLAPAFISFSSALLSCCFSLKKKCPFILKIKDVFEKIKII